MQRLRLAFPEGDRRMSFGGVLFSASCFIVILWRPHFFDRRGILLRRLTNSVRVFRSFRTVVLGFVIKPVGPGGHDY